MTITYTAKVANARLWGFSRLLFYWKGSIYKIMYKEMLLFIGLYTFLSLLYRFILLDDQKRLFEKIVIYCETFTNLIPITFVLGFYVSIVVTRWWQQFMSIPWPDSLMTYVGSLVHGSDERGRLIRRTMMRYLHLGLVMIFRCNSPVVMKRFPTLGHVVDAGIMTKDELRVYNNLTSQHSKFWVPCMWFCSLASQARSEGRIKDDILLKTLLDECNKFRAGLGMMYNYDWLSIPLVYTQVTTLAVYTYILASIISSQYLDPAQNIPHHTIDLYIPAFTVLQFFFYMGWIKVAEQLINPFGEDDDDFEVNWMIDRNLQVSLLAVDEMYMATPKLERDMYWDELEPELPYTQSTYHSKLPTFMGSTADMSLTSDDMKVVHPLETINENGDSKSHGGSHHHLHQDNLIHSIPSHLSSPTKPRRFHSNLRENLLRPKSLDTLNKKIVNNEMSGQRLNHSFNVGRPFKKKQGEPERVREYDGSYTQQWVSSLSEHFPASNEVVQTLSGSNPWLPQSPSKPACASPEQLKKDIKSGLHVTVSPVVDDPLKPKTSRERSVTICTDNPSANIYYYDTEEATDSGSSTKPDVGIQKLAQSPEEVPSVVISLPEEGDNYGYMTDSNQSTVNSMTPLLADQIDHEVDNVDVTDKTSVI